MSNELDRVTTYLTLAQITRLFILQPTESITTLSNSKLTSFFFIHLHRVYLVILLTLYNTHYT